MIEFATLFLGLYVGVAPVEVLVGSDVASVEMRLDGEPIGELSGPPWILPCDLGRELVPHVLVAVARDASGREVARARQEVNVPRSAGEARVVVGRDPVDGARVAQVSWNSATGGVPEEVRATLDGSSLEVLDPRRIALPDDGEERVHFLRVEVALGGGALAVAETVYGGRYGESVRTDLTGIPVWSSRRETPAPAAFGDRVRLHGEPVHVVGVEKGLADLVVVPDLRSREWLLALRHGTPGGVRRGSGWIGTPGAGYRFAGAFPRDLRIRILWPLVESLRGEASTRSLLHPSPEMSPWEAGFLAHLETFRPPADRKDQRIADAVAMAGLVAAEPGRRRAVLLMVSGNPEDASELSAADTRAFLDRLGVPLFVWRIGDGAPDAGPWGAGEPVTSLRRLEKGFKRIGRVLDRQRVVWIAASALAREVDLETAGSLLPVGVAPWIEGLPAEGLEPDAEAGLEPPAPEPSRAPPQAPALDPDRLERALAAMDGPVSLARLGPFEVHFDFEGADRLLDLAPVAAALEADYRERYGVVPVAVGREAVVLFGRESSYRAYAGEELPAADEQIAGHAGGGLAAVLVGDRDPDQVRALFVHELTHLLNRRAFGPRLPPWLEEGMADEPALASYGEDGRPLPGTWWGDTRIAGRSVQDRAGGVQGIVRREGSVGALHDLANRAVRGALVPLPVLLAMDWGPFLEPEGRTLRYAESAFLVRYLLEGRIDTRRDGFRAFLASVAKGGPDGPAALQDALGEPLETVEAGFRSWLRFQQATLRLKGQ